MEIRELNSSNIVPEISNIIARQEECLIWGIPDKNYVFTGYQNNKINNDNLKKYNAVVLNFPNEGGAIVTSAGDFDLGHFSKNINNKFGIQLLEKVKEYLKEKNINVILADNDLLIDGKYKCGSYSSRRFNDILYTAVHISISADVDMINSICLKPMNKIPKGLSEFGITTDEIKNFIIKNTIGDICQ